MTKAQKQAIELLFGQEGMTNKTKFWGLVGGLYLLLFGPACD